MRNDVASKEMREMVCFSESLLCQNVYLCLYMSTWLRN